MASHESAVKAHRQSVVKRDANRLYRARLRGALRAIRTAIDLAEAALGQVRGTAAEGQISAFIAQLQGA